VPITRVNPDDPDSSLVITGRGIALYRLLTLRSGLKLEMKGLRLTRGSTCYAIAKRELGLTGSREKVLEKLERIIDSVEADKENL
jgi:hypothetical protein